MRLLILAIARYSSGDGDPDFDETECEICMDKQKQVVLPCTHSFCLYCFQHWCVVIVYWFLLFFLSLTLGIGLCH